MIISMQVMKVFILRLNKSLVTILWSIDSKWNIDSLWNYLRENWEREASEANTNLSVTSIDILFSNGYSEKCVASLTIND
jgi:hypothetical protein